MTISEAITFVDLSAQRRVIGAKIDAAVLRVMEHGQYIMGPEVEVLENDLAAFCGVKHVISCASGTDALALVLMADGLKPGDAVFCPSFTFCATAEVVAWLGATPVFVDCDRDSFNMDPESLKKGIEKARSLGLKPAYVIPVDLFGLPADYESIIEIADSERIKVLSDAAQSFGAEYGARRVGNFGRATATSFFPAKPLGCYGDGGAVMTDDDNLAHIIKSLRVHGKGEDKYDNVRIGMTARLDTVQAAILIEKLKIFEQEITNRNLIAERYSNALSDMCVVPRVGERYKSVWAQYTLLLPAVQRDFVAGALKQRGVPTAIYYPKPLHKQKAYAHYPTAGNGLPVSEELASRVLSIPMHPYLDENVQDYIISSILSCLALR